jgi:hypothetical protein
MKRISLPEEVVRKAAELAARDEVSVEEFISAAIAEHAAGRRYLAHRAGRANLERFRAALRQIPDVEPAEYDRL